MADTPKAPPPPQAVEPGTIFIRNPGGVVHDVIDGTNPGVELAKKGESGWRLASDDEVREYCKRNNLEAPSKKAQAAEPASYAPEEPAKAGKKP